MLDETKKVSSGKKRVSVDSMESDDNSMNLGLEARKKYLAERQRQKEILRKEEEERIETAKKEEEKKAEHERQEMEKKTEKHFTTINWFFIAIPLLLIAVSLCMIPKYFFMYAWQIVLLVLFCFFTIVFVFNCIKVKKVPTKIKEKVDTSFNGTILAYLASVIFLVITISLSCVYKYDRSYEGYDNGYFYNTYRQGYAQVYANDAHEFRIPSKVDGKYVKYIKFLGNIKKIKKVYLPDSFDIIESNQFYEFSNLEYVELPRAVSIIERFSFGGCWNLKTPSFGPRLESIGYAAFNSCDQFETLSFDKGLKNIGSYAFSGCDRLSYVQLPNTIEHLGIDIFDGCNRLKAINYMGTVEQWNAMKKVQSENNHYWYSGSSIEKVICLDGTITLEAE